MTLSTATRASLDRRASQPDGTQKMYVLRWDQRLDGLFTETAAQQKLEALGYEPLPRSNPAGAIVSARVHRRERAAAVLAGLVKVTIEDQSVILTAGDIVVVPGGAPRRIEAVGTSPVLCLEAVNRSLA